MRLKIILGSVLVVAVIVVGCGGGSDTSGGTSAGGTSSTTTAASTDGGGGGKPLTKKEFIKKGDQICSEVPTEYQELKEKLEKESSKKPTTAEVNLAAAVPPVEAAVGKMEKLTPPKGDEAEIEAIIDALEAAGKGVEKNPTAPLIGPKSAYYEFQQLTEKYGFALCTNL